MKGTHAWCFLCKSNQRIVDEFDGHIEGRNAWIVILACNHELILWRD